MNSTTTQLAKELLAISSISPDQSGAQDILAKRLNDAGFVVEQKELCGCKNLWARIGKKAPLMVFSGHTDVVPAGDLSRWSSAPFAPSIRDGKLYARGAADMKGSIASMVVAALEFIKDYKKDLPFSIGFLITGDEEIAGAAAKEYLSQLRNEKIDFCLVGEPSSLAILGDTLKIGRRGSLHGKLKVKGIQGHVGYPHLAENALHKILEPLALLTKLEWNDKNEFFDVTTFQITSVKGGVAGNVIPGEAEAVFNFRYSIASTKEQIIERVESTLRNIKNLNYSLDWTLDAKPFLTSTGYWCELVQRVLEEFGIKPELSTSGGTSDARHFAELGIQVIELGPNNKTIHQYDEFILVDELNKLTEIYLKVLQKIAAK